MLPDTKHCLICRRPNRTLHWHRDLETSDIWVYCVGKCQRGYSLKQYCSLGDILPEDLLKGDFEFQEAKSNEIQAMQWPAKFIPLNDPRAAPGVKYIRGRGLSLDSDMYYDIDRDGIVFPYYFDKHFCGAQIRFIKDNFNKSGDLQKVDTVPGTRLGMLFGLWNQTKFFTNVKAVGVCEGYFNALSLQQAFNTKYGGVANNPWKFISTSGCNVSLHHREVLKELKDNNIKIICAYDHDEAGLAGLNKMIKAECLTHFSTTQDTDKDWNDMLLKDGPHHTATRFLMNLKAAANV